MYSIRRKASRGRRAASNASAQLDGGFPLRRGVRDDQGNKAQAKGKKVGRPQLTKDGIPAIFYKHYPTFMAGKMNLSELARICGLSRPTVYKYLNMIG